MNKKHLKLLKTHENNIFISDKNLHNKFLHFEDDLLDESKTLLYEIEEKPKKFKRYSRGTIIKVKFGINLGSEFSGEHFAIVVSKKDTMLCPILHVIPITSKIHKKGFKIGSILYNEKELKILKNIESRSTSKNVTLKIQKIIKYYSKRKGIISYACIDQLKTISKLAISKNINEYDYLPHLKCSNDLMKKIDKEIIKEYTLETITPQKIS